MDSANTDLTYNVAQLLKEHIGANRNLTLETSSLALGDASVFEDDVRLQAFDVQGSVRATRLADGLLVQGEVQAEVDLLCSRCLETFRLPVEASVEEQFLPVVDVETGHAIHREGFEENDAAFEIDANHLMDMSEAVRQTLLVSLPMKPLCREECAGICPDCGANRNDIDCGHTPQMADDRWAGLRLLKLEEFAPGSENQN